MSPFTVFALLTIIYAIIKYHVSDGKTALIIGVVYVCLLAISMYFLNLGLTKEMCGTTQPGTALLVTAIPWSLVFGVLALMLIVFPGWLSPFSNTLGYLAAKLAGVGTIMDKIIKSRKDADKTTAPALEQIYGDKALLVNQLTESNFEGFWSLMKGGNLFRTEANQYKEALRKIVRLKNTIAELTWALLAGGLATSISNSYILGSACQQSAKEMIQRHNQYEAETDNAAPKEKRVYTVSN